MRPEVRLEKPCRRWSGTHRASDGRPIEGKRYGYRLVYEAEVGPLPTGVAHHICENCWCVEPTHLEFITQGEHLHRHGLTGDNHQAAKTQCPQGHDYDEENTYHYTRKDGRRERHCRKCTITAKRRFRAKKQVKGTPQ